MRKRLHDYVVFPNASRRKADRWTLGIAILSSLIAWANTLRGADSAKIGIAVFGLGLLGTTFAHLLRSDVSDAPVYKPQSLRREFSWLGVTAAIFGVVALVSKSLDARLIAAGKFQDLGEESFAKSLPQLRNALINPNPEKTVDHQAFLLIARKLQSTNVNAPQYWPTLTEFIRFVSSRTTKNVPPPGKPTITIANNRGGPIGLRFKHEIVLLDGGDLGNAVFQNCRIIFTEHPVRMFGVSFKDCVFDFPENDHPNPYLKKVMTQLLASNFSAIPEA